MLRSLVPQDKDVLWPIVQEKEWWPYDLKGLSIAGELGSYMAGALDIQTASSNGMGNDAQLHEALSFTLLKLYQYFKIKRGPTGPLFIF